MAEKTQQSLINSIIEKGNELIVLARGAYIFRASVAYIVQQVYSFNCSVKTISHNVLTTAQIQALREAHDNFSHFALLLPHLSNEKWLQPAINWPANYVHNYIDGFRETLNNLTNRLGLEDQVLKFDPQQEAINRRSDLKNLKKSLQEIISTVNSSETAGVEKQIEARIKEIKKMIPSESKKHGGQRRPSCDGMPAVQMEHRVEELLGQFKNINIPLEDIKIECQIGTGGFGNVSRATRLSTSEIVAVKELRRDRLTMSAWTSLYAEVETMASVRYQHVLELVGAHITQPYRIITRFCPGKSLFDRLHRVGSKGVHLTSTELTKVAYQVALGMRKLHSMNIVHRDLKTLNILLDEYNDGYVADFGLSGMMKNNQELVGGVGTPHYTAPEVLMHTRYGPKVDSFSYGVVLWEMLMRKVPYSNMSAAQIYEHVVTRGWRLPIPNDTPEGLKKLIARCWNKNPNDRPFFDEIVTLFENGEIFFPDSEKINCEEIKSTHHCPPIDFPYALSVLSDAKSENFQSVTNFITSNYDEKVRRWLRENKVVPNLVNATVKRDSVLLLASVALEGDEFEQFLNQGGLEMFKSCVETSRSQQITSAVKFGLKVPDKQLEKIQPFLPKIISFLQTVGSSSSEHIIQFLTRFDANVLHDYIQEIGQSIVKIAIDVNDQNTFDAISTLLEICCSTLTKEELHSFYHLLTEKLIVKPSFVETLINTNDRENTPELMFSILKATEHSDIDTVFIKFLKNCLHSDKDVFLRFVNNEELYTTLEHLLAIGRDRSALFVLFCICSIGKVRDDLVDSSLISVLLQMKDHVFQRLQIFTVLCLSKDFCVRTKYMDGITHFLVSALSDKDLVNAGVRLIGALSSHSAGVQVLTDNGVLELFAQLFLSSSSGDTTTSHTIMRNIAENGGEIPQISLIVSCLMQDMLVVNADKAEIMETACSLVKTMPASIQEHDLQKIVLPFLTNESEPRLVYYSLKLLSVSEASKLGGFYQKVLQAICVVLENEKLLYPDIIEAALDTIRSIGEMYNLGEFIAKTHLEEYVNGIKLLLSPESSDLEKISALFDSITNSTSQSF